MKKILLFIFTLLLCLGCGNNNQQEEQHKGPRQGMRMQQNKDDDSAFVALKESVVPTFKQFTYQDQQSGKSLEYNLFIPDGWEDNNYPLVLFIADASTAGKEVTAPLTQGYGALLFASARDQQKHPSFVLVPQFTETAVDDNWNHSDEVDMTIRLLKEVAEKYHIDNNRLYTTGQSMGGMISFYYNIAYPDVFAASMFVGSQWDTSKMNDFGNKRFFYIVAGGDQKASGGMRDLAAVLNEHQAKIDSASWSAKLPSEEQDKLASQLIARGGHVNFITFEAGSVLPEDGRGMEHMASFDYAYKLTPVRDWLFEQSR
ncbi:MAG: alpha/beta fold hydrolase [Muribaculaceae bacterium]|nr:alpha/beta fold hydrolase [Muribaculaceae bacterium]